MESLKNSKFEELSKEEMSENLGGFLWWGSRTETVVCLDTAPVDCESYKSTTHYTFFGKENTADYCVNQGMNYAETEAYSSSNGWSD